MGDRRTRAREWGRVSGRSRSGAGGEYVSKPRAVSREKYMKEAYEVAVCWGGEGTGVIFVLLLAV